MSCKNTLPADMSTVEVFYRQFKKETNLTPADYRKKYSAYPESWGRLCALQNLKGK